jgi:23S rRNA pseudouridine2604 synthase
MTSISLNKFISDTGYCSRREADRLIEAGRVLLNNEIAVTGNRYEPGDEVVVDGSIIKPAIKEKKVILAFNKPTGITTTTEANIPGNIISFINYPKRIFPIGRLDKDSQGLIFLTNDGDLVNKILRAGNRHEKEYLVRVHKPIDGFFLKQMSEGVKIDGQRTLPCRIRQTGKQSFSIILVQGLNRQIRKMCEALGYNVTFLQRIRIMHISLGKIPVGKWRHLSEPEMDQLEQALEGSAGTRDRSPKRTRTNGASLPSSGAVKVQTPKEAPETPKKEGAKKRTSYIEFRRKGKNR